MKLRLYKAHMAQTLNFYNEQLTGRYGPIAMSEAQKETMRRDLINLQKQMMVSQRTNSWQVPVLLVFEANGTYNVIVENEHELLYLD